MFDAKRLLDQFLGAQTGDAGLAGGGAGASLGDIAKNLGGQFGGGGLAGGALAGGLAGLMLGTKTGRKIGGTALKVGGMAVVGALAYKAYRNWQDGKKPVAETAPATPMLPPPSGTPFNPVGEAAQQSLGRTLLRAMISASKADGHLDAAEQSKIFAAMDKFALDADDKAFVMDELRAPLDIDSVAQAARTPEEAAEIYTVSLLAIDVDNPAERGYLALLAARLKLEDALVAHLHASVEGATEPATTA
jgi:uncharacterized membrane protein YebE (DUF533 family)